MRYIKVVNQHTFFIGILSKFQWIGFLISTDNPITYSEYLVIEFRLLWLRVYYTYDFKKHSF